MKNINKCYLYFAFIIAFCVLTLVSFILTHNKDGLARMRAFNLNYDEFYCFSDINAYNQCNDQTKLMANCDLLKDRMNACKTSVEENKERVKNYCF